MARSERLAWDIAPVDRAAKADAETRISDFLAFVGLTLPSLVVPVIDLPLGELSAVAIGLLALFRTPAPDAAVRLWFRLGVLFVPAWLMATSLAHGSFDERRLVHITAWALLALAMSSGRISTVSAGRGLAVGLPISVVASLFGAGVSGNAYEGRLSGWIGDPNAAAFYIAVLGLVAMAFMKSPWVRALLAAGVVAGVVLCFSRTGLIVIVGSLLWIVVGRRLRFLGGALAVTGVALLVQYVPDDLRLWGPFANRQGSDDLRDRIFEAEQAKLDAAPWYGNGAGTSSVTIQNQDFFFHSSYFGVVNEGGLPLAIVLVALLVGVFITLGRVPRIDVQTACLQMGLIAPLLMAFTLGEVLLDLPVAVALGAAARHAWRAPARAPAAEPVPAGAAL